MRVGLLSLTGLTDPTLYWMCRDLEANPAIDIQAGVVVPDTAYEEFGTIGNIARSYLSRDRDYDLLLVFGADEREDSAARIIRTLNCREIVVCDSYEEEAIGYKVSAALSFVANKPVSSFEERIGGSGVFSMPRLKFFGGYALDGPASGSIRHGTGPGHGGSIVFSVARDEIESIVPMLDNSFAAREITILTKGSIKSSLMARKLLCKIYAISEAPIDFILRNADRMIDLSDSISGDMHRYILYSALSRNAHIYCKKRLAEFIPFAPSYVGPDDTRDYFFSITNVLRDHADRQILPEGRAAAMLQSYRERLTSLLASNKAARRRPRGRIIGRNATPKYCFVAINGNGLGHAQRVLSIAREVQNSHAGKKTNQIRIATFPSCIDFVRSNGFDVVPLLTRQAQATDASIELVNFKRLSGALRDATILVFDGGYPYDSVVSACQAFRGPKVWIRRGLWRDDQDNRIAFEREKYFDRIVRPLEAFEELNGNPLLWRADPNEVAVGPIVADNYDGAALTWAAGLRGKRGRLVVSMLGGGLTSDRSNMLYSISRELERYDDVIHLAVSWPQAVYHVPINRFANTKLVATNFGSSILSKADLYIGAAGYNTFHECMYQQLPAIFVPQAASWLDDQEARANAAEERGLGISVSGENLLEIRRGIDFMLSGGGIRQCRAKFRKVDLPETGNRRVARNIMELERRMRC